MILYESTSNATLLLSFHFTEAIKDYGKYCLLGYRINPICFFHKGSCMGMPKYFIKYSLEEPFS